MWQSLRFGLVLFCFLCPSSLAQDNQSNDGCEIVVLGIAQDAGFPQAGCEKPCCRDAWNQPELRRYASCLAIVDHQSNQRWLLDCTPDFREQLRLLDELAPMENKDGVGIDGIFLTHAHIGHYAGLIHLGREAIGANSIPVHVMPRMKSFLETNGPWDQLVKLENISLKPLQAKQPIELNERLSIQPFLVPHRDEYSETVGFIITGPNHRSLYLPDIDKWSRWDESINELVKTVDTSFIDGTFFANGEIPGRDMAEIPHPFVEESIAQFSNLSRQQREGIFFIHLNHTNPVLSPDSEQKGQLQRSGLSVAQQRQTIKL